MKQRYVLDYDDILNIGFMKQSNAEALLSGLNESGTTVALGVAAGGLGNTAFTAGQTLVYDGQKIVSSGAPPTPASPSVLTNDSRYYTKPQIDAFFASLATMNGPIQVDYSNLLNAPNAPVKLQFLTTPLVVFSGNTVMASEVEEAVTGASGQKVVGALLTCTASLSGPDGIPPAIMRARMNSSAAWIDVGWFQAAASGDYVANAAGSVIPVDPTAQSFKYQLVCGSLAPGATCVDPGPVTLKLIGYLYI